MHYLSYYIESAFGSRLQISIHTLRILIHGVGSLPHILPTRLGNHSATTRQPIRIKCYVTRVVSQSESNITSPESSPENSRQPIRVKYYVTRVVSQSKLSITSPESFRLGWSSPLGSRLESTRYSLS